LPYAFHGKRIFSEIFAIENNLPHTTNEDLKAVAGSDAYKALVNEKIETSQRASSEIGNMYTASVFMALLSALQVSANEGEDLSGKKIGFFAYGAVLSRKFSKLQ
jgi:hydroxymethylglutaryl-CoA synthase